MVSVDREERGAGEISALREIEGEYGFKTLSIVKMSEVVSYLKTHEVNGQKIIDSELESRIEAYYKEYGAKEA